MAFTGGNIKMLNNSLTALNGQNLNLNTTGAGQVLVNGDVITSSGNFNVLASQVALNTSNIGAPSPAVLSPTLFAGVSSALSGGANDSTARSSANNAQTTANTALAQSGVTSIVAGTGISVSSPTGAVTITATPTPVLSKYVVTINNVALGAGFTDQASFTITPTIDAAVLNVWGSVTASEAGSDGILDVRLLINTIPTTFQSATIPNNHQQTISVFGTGTGGLPGLPVTISVQARESAGNLTKLTAMLMCIAQTTSV